MNSTGRGHHRAVVALGAALLAVPLAGVLSAPAWATDTTSADHGKALAKGHADSAADNAAVAAPLVGPVAPATTATSTTATATSATTTTATTTVAGPVAPTTSSSDHSTGTAATVGSVTSPQPASNADLNNTGANDTSKTNQYTSTRSGLPSLNGNGTSGGGKPCAGCVGKADNKNPPGQYPNGTDANAGYECDRNNGIGKTNPAHTGCPPTRSVTPPTPPKPPTPPGPCLDTVGPVIPGTTLHTCLPSTGSTGGTTQHPVTGGSVPLPGSVAPPAVIAHSTSGPAALPFTGAPVGVLAEAAALLVLAGFGLVLGTRPRES